MNTRRGCSIPATLLIASALLSRGEPYAIFKLAAWLSIAYLAGRHLRPVFLLSSFAAAGVFESLVGISQFALHRSIGLSFFGESVLSPLDPALARTFVSGGRLLRAYGTFPHPNIFAAFLALSIISLAYFHMRSGARLRVAFVVPIFISCVGLILTFSRTGWIAGAFGFFVVIFLSHKRLPSYARNTAFVFAACVLAAVSIFSFAALPRLTLVGSHDYAVMARMAGYHEALRQISLRPFFGSGITMRMGANPVHSAYLLVAEEIGLFGLVAFLLVLYAALRKGFRDPRPEYQALFAMLCLLSVAGLTDHFLWTLRPGAAMLWVVIGMLSFENRRISHS